MDHHHDQRLVIASTTGGGGGGGGRDNIEGGRWMDQLRQHSLSNIRVVVTIRCDQSSLMNTSLIWGRKRDFDLGDWIEERRVQFVFKNHKPSVRRSDGSH
ncbi:hypothetical protein H6P81_007811 [Aristolochia fimbriata]|uniref:Uncharacterized protein n=1 Tax=Aristolochia fimbriata TaxID=158543 RepID=A0AAV7F543_ARIFI|nr:hypothetical protein H6P81_007811 [Aristolochia fimbriata]